MVCVCVCMCFIRIHFLNENSDLNDCCANWQGTINLWMHDCKSLWRMQILPQVSWEAAQNCCSSFWWVFFRIYNSILCLLYPKEEKKFLGSVSMIWFILIFFFKILYIIFEFQVLFLKGLVWYVTLRIPLVGRIGNLAKS